jgi:hypothetical protein
MKITGEDLEAIRELTDQVDGYKVIFDELVNTYGDDVENVFKRLMRASARVQHVYYEELINQGFSQKEAFTLLLDARNAIKSMNLASKAK